ncbi:MAG: hypothetical protein PHN82_04795 [bacterium]|nr:hypothetical protein [bacterium]
MAHEKREGKSRRLKPISLHPLPVQDAISAFIAVDPKKIEERMKREKKQD